MAILNFFDAVSRFVSADRGATQGFEKMVMGIARNGYARAEETTMSAGAAVRDHADWARKNAGLSAGLRRRIEDSHRRSVQAKKGGTAFVKNLYRLSNLAEESEQHYADAVERMVSGRGLERLFASMEEKLRAKLLVRARADRDFLLERAGESPALMAWLKENSPPEHARVHKLTEAGGEWRQEEARQGVVGDVLDRLYEQRTGSRRDGTERGEHPATPKRESGEGAAARYIELVSSGARLVDRLEAAALVMENPLEMVRVANRGGPEGAEALMRDFSLFNEPKGYVEMERKVVKEAVVGLKDLPPDLAAGVKTLGDGKPVDAAIEYRLIARLEGEGALITAELAERRLALASQIGRAPEQVVGLVRVDREAASFLEADMQALGEGRKPASAVMESLASAKSVAEAAMPAPAPAQEVVTSATKESPVPPVSAEAAPVELVDGKAVVIKSAVDFRAVLAELDEGKAFPVALALATGGQAASDTRLMDAINAADPADLKKLYDATKAYVDAQVESGAKSEKARGEQDGAELGRRLLGAALLSAVAIDQDAFYRDGTSLVSRKGKELSAENRLDAGDHFQAGRKSLQEVLDVGPKKKAKRAVPEDRVKA